MTGDDSAPPVRSWAELYTVADELTLRAQTGGALAVQGEVDEVLPEARAAGAHRVVHRLLYASALSAARLESLEECTAACDELAAEAGDRLANRGWLSSSHSLKAIVRIIEGRKQQAMEELLEAAVALHETPTEGPAHMYAINGLGVGYLGVGLYELATEMYDGVAEKVRIGEFKLSRLFHLLNAQLAHTYWALDLDRIGDSQASTHFLKALEITREAWAYLPDQDRETWELRLRARSGLCLAFLGETEIAIERLEPVVTAMARRELDEEVMSRMGLVRAYAAQDRERASDLAERLIDAVKASTDRPLALSAAWERTRLHTMAADTAATPAARYTRILERDRWDQRTRDARATRGRIQRELDRRAAAATDTAFLDAGTGLPNRFALEVRLRSCIERAQEGSDPVSLAVISIDRDAGVDTMNRLAATLDVDFLARLSAHELAAIGVGQHASELADRVRRCDPLTVGHLTVGVASLAAPTSVSALLVHADEALLEAARRGGPEVVVNTQSSRPQANRPC